MTNGEHQRTIGMWSKNCFFGHVALRKWIMTVNISMTQLRYPYNRNSLSTKFVHAKSPTTHKSEMNTRILISKFRFLVGRVYKLVTVCIHKLKFFFRMTVAMSLRHNFFFFLNTCFDLPMVLRMWVASFTLRTIRQHTNQARHNAHNSVGIYTSVCANREYIECSFSSPLS